MKDPIEAMNKDVTGTLKWSALIFAGLLLIGGGGYWLYSSFSGPNVAVPEKGGTLYTCGMHPQVIQSEPGNCPICGMELTPMNMAEHAGHDHSAWDDAKKTKEMSGEAEGEHAGHKETDGIAAKDKMSKAMEGLTVRVAPAVIQKMGLRTDVVKKSELTRVIRAVSHIGFNEKTETVINSRVNGWAEVLYAEYEGQRIHRGQPLVGIYSPELVATQEEYLHLLRQMRTAGPEGATEIRSLIQSARQRLKYWNVSSAQINRIERTGKVSRLLTLYSPYSGVVVKKGIVKGARVMEGMDLFHISDLSTVWVYVHISEKDIPFIEEGMDVRVDIPQIPGKEFKGHVSFIFPYMNAQARDLKVRVSLPNPDLELKPGMYANLHLNNTLEGEYVLAPSSAIIRTGERSIVFVYRGEGVFEPREVKTGITDGEDRIQILEGLSEDEAVVTSGQFLLDSESRIQEAVRKLRAEGVDAKAAPGGHQH